MEIGEEVFKVIFGLYKLNYLPNLGVIQFSFAAFASDYYINDYSFGRYTKKLFKKKRARVAFSAI